jgi:hypothetical protein
LRKFGYENGRKGIWKLLNIEEKRHWEQGEMVWDA